MAGLGIDNFLQGRLKCSCDKMQPLIFCGPPNLRKPFINYQVFPATRSVALLFRYPQSFYNTVIRCQKGEFFEVHISALGDSSLVGKKLLTEFQPSRSSLQVQGLFCSVHDIWRKDGRYSFIRFRLQMNKTQFHRFLQSLK